jgi:hypothetical protein
MGGYRLFIFCTRGIAAKEFFSMKKIFWIIALVAVIVFSFAACDDGSTGGGGGRGGTFTITDIPAEFNGVDAMVYLASNESITIFGENTRISNGRVSIPLFISVGGVPKDYFGNDTGCRVEVHLGGITSTRGSIVFGRQGTPGVNFSNGSATRSWNEGWYH